MRGGGDEPSAGFWSYIDVYDLADDAACSPPSPTCPGTRSSTSRSPTTSAGLPLADLVRRHHGDAIELRDSTAPTPAGISTAKAQRMLGWKPKRSWRDYLDETGATRSR